MNSSVHQPPEPTLNDVVIIIPALNEAARIEAVLTPCLAANLGPVVVVDDGSSDATGEVAARAGATVIRLPHNQGKAAAMLAGAEPYHNYPFFMFIDGDLINLQTHHLHALAEPLRTGSADMSRGDFKGGRWQTHLSQNISPILNGQRCIRSELFLAIPELGTLGYGVEVAIAAAAKAGRWRVHRVPLQGVAQVMKEEKESSQGLSGMYGRLKMYRQVLAILFQRFFPKR